MLSHAPSIDLENIQGNIFGGFLKDHREMVFLQFHEPAGARAWLGGILGDISTSAEVIAFNRLFKMIRATKGREGIVKATWTNIALTYTGLKHLGVSNYYLQQFPDAFKLGMAARADKLGDVGDSAPEHWIGPFGDPARIVHAVLIIEADDPRDLAEAVACYRQNFHVGGPVEEIAKQAGATLPEPLTGHEHFGFKDGVSQPAIRGVDLPDDPFNPNQGHPGQDMLHPGEFVLGYPTQIPEPDPAVDGPNPNPGPISTSGPPWTRDGSYLVYRRLGQNVPAFHKNVEDLTAKSCIPHATTDLIGAKLVGRYKSGCPLEQLKSSTGDYTPPLADPGKDHPQAGDDNSINNFFEYGRDALGDNVPRAAHIRKAYPRDQAGTSDSGTESESQTQTHRLLRRGIPYGNPYKPGTDGGEAGDARGLLFLCYQKDIEQQFEFVQRVWVNDPNFPCDEATKQESPDLKPLYPNGLPDSQDGQDPIIATSPAGPYYLSTAKSDACPVGGDRVKALPHFVTTTGGDYFFSPSLSALLEIAANAFSK